TAWYLDSKEKLHLIRLPAGTSGLIDLRVSGEISWRSVFWTPSGDKLVMTLMVYEGSKNTGITLALDLATNRLRPLQNGPQLLNGFRAEPSPDGRYLEFSGPCQSDDWPGGCVLDLVTGTTVTLKPIQLGTFGYLDWHPSRPWLFVTGSDVDDFGLLFLAS